MLNQGHDSHTIDFIHALNFCKFEPQMNKITPMFFICALPLCGMHLCSSLIVLMQPSGQIHASSFFFFNQGKIQSK